MRADSAPASVQPDESPACDISVVIPTRNRPTKLHRCLAGLSNQTLDHNRFEVIVVNDGGRPLDAALEVWRTRLRLRTLDQSHAGPAAARNAGASIAHGALLAFTDDDCEPQPDWLKECANRLHEAPNQAIGGHTQNALQDNVYSTASQLLIDYLYERHEAADRHPSSRTRMPAFVTSNNLAVSAEIFKRLGGFDRSFTRAAAEDRDFCERWQEHGYQLARVPAAVVNHAHPLTLARFWRQHVNYGRGAYTLRRVRAARGTPPPKFESFSFYVGLLRYPLRSPSLKSPLLITLLFVSQVANAFGFLVESARSAIVARRT